MIEQLTRAYPDRIRLPLAFDPHALRADLDALAGVEWTPHFVHQNYEGEWSAIALRSKAGATHPIMKIYSDPAATMFEDDALLAHAPAFAGVLASLACPIRAVRLMRLTPGSTIREHGDHDLAAELGKARLHLPVATDPRAEFMLNRTRVEMAPGELWYLRLADPHSAVNRGDADRVHMVIDVEANDWLYGLLDRGVQDQPAA